MTTSIGDRRTVAAVGVAVLLMGTVSVLNAGPNATSRQIDPVGAWTVTVTLRDCATGAPLGAPFNSLVTIHSGGTQSETTASRAFAPGQRSPGHGVWERRGRRTFDSRFISLVLFDTPPNLPNVPGYDHTQPVSPGFSEGWSTVSHRAVYSDADHSTSAGTNDFYRADGTVYRTGCSTASAERLR